MLGNELICDTYFTNFVNRGWSKSVKIYIIYLYIINYHTCVSYAWFYHAIYARVPHVFINSLQDYSFHYFKG